MRIEKQVIIGRTICRYSYNRPEIDKKVPGEFYRILIDEIRRKRDAERIDGVVPETA